MNKSPKQRFQDLKPIAATHRDTVDRDAFAIAMDMALLELLDRRPRTNVTTEQAASLYHQIVGAMSYMDILANLGEAPKEKAPLPDGNLIHRP